MNRAVYSECVHTLPLHYLFQLRDNSVMKLLHIWRDSSLLARILVGFFLGIVVGGLLWFFDSSGTFESDMIFEALAPVGELLVKMLKMIVIPVIFSLWSLALPVYPWRSLARSGLLLLAGIC